MRATEKDPELELFRDNVQRFIADEVEPHIAQWEKDGKIPREFWNRLGEMCFLCVDLPEEYGGYGVNFHYSMVITEEFAKAGMAAISTNLTVHSDICAHYILNNGTQEQKQYYLPKMVSGEIVGAIAMTEPGAGSDLQGIRTSAKSSGDSYIINGSKTFISNGQHCDLIVLAARTNMDVSGAKGTSMILVDASTPGFSRGRNLEKIGMHSADTSELFFEDVTVPKSKLLGNENAGFSILMNELARERLSLAAGGVAAAEGALAITIEYVNERVAFGAPISQLQNTKFEMAKMATEVRVNRSFVEECKDLFMGDKLDVETVSMAKLSTTEMQGRVVDGCLQLFGGYGYMVEYPISRFYIDARIQRIYGGTSEIMKELISRSVLAR